MAKLADDRGRNPIIWFFGGSFLRLFSVAILFLSPKKEKIVDLGTTRKMMLKKCPECGEIIKIDDSACKYCGAEQY